MRKRDLAILMLSGFAIFFTLQHEGDFAFKEAWFHLYDEYPVKYEADRLPPRIVADLNGDGKEVLVATNDAKIQVLEPHSRRVDEGFSEARILAEISLLPDKIRIASGRRDVAMATGVIDRYYKDGTPQKQVLVVVTSGWSVLCFDHNLKKLWETNLQVFYLLRSLSNVPHKSLSSSFFGYGIIGRTITPDWNYTLQSLTSTRRKKDDKVILCLLFQITIYFIWCERNNRRHGIPSKNPDSLAQTIAKTIWLRLQSRHTENREETTRLLHRWNEVKTS